jgi:serine protease AprX
VASTGKALEAYPNPFSGTVTFSYALAQPGPVRLELLDALGRRVALLVDGTQEAGHHEAHFQAPSQGAELYLVRLITAEGSTTQKLARRP